jgi:hypothetical protein
MLNHRAEHQHYKAQKVTDQHNRNEVCASIHPITNDVPLYREQQPTSRHEYLEWQQ